MTEYFDSLMSALYRRETTDSSALARLDGRCSNAGTELTHEHVRRALVSLGHDSLARTYAAAHMDPDVGVSPTSTALKHDAAVSTRCPCWP